ncbi:MAG: hypothetical protein Q9192_004033 [Flavoplaca navasiana]
MESLQQPSMVPPPDGDTSKGPSMLIIIWLFTAISTIVVGLKMWTRLKIIREFGADDVLTILALLFLLAFAPLITVSVHQGLGKHIFYLTPKAAMQSTKLAVLSNPLVFLASAWPNISVAISLNRILVPQPWQLIFLYGIPILQCVFGFICSIITYTTCSPLEGLWNPAVPHTCLPNATVVGILYFNGALSAFTHVFLAVVPIFGLWKIRIKLKTKIGVCLLMGTTATAAIAAIGRTVHTDDADLRTDFTYAVHRLSKWATYTPLFPQISSFLILFPPLTNPLRSTNTPTTSIEAAFIITASCIPSLRPFVRVLGKSLHIESAKALFVVPKGYHHSHSRRHRPPPLVPRDSGSGTPALGSGTTVRPSPKDKYEVYGDVDRDVEKGDGRINEVATSGVGATNAEKIVEEDERGGVGEKGVDTTRDATTTSTAITKAEKTSKEEKQGGNAEKGMNTTMTSSAASSTPETEEINEKEKRGESWL